VRFPRASGFRYDERSSSPALGCFTATAAGLPGAAARQDAMNGKRTVFFVSDRTGITAETLGHSLLTQFDTDFEQVTLPFTDNADRARAVLNQISEANRINESRSIVFSTIIDDEVREIIRGADAVVFDFFDTFIAPLERELNVRSSHTIGRSHGLVDNTMYDVRIDAMNYALKHDDGVSADGYGDAGVILIAPSRCGETNSVSRSR
jgi:regulator of PEP synthase PpsR (kinase-PPPase family)